MPIKHLEVAKSRLRGALPGVPHEALVLAMALDTLAAALASTVVGRVVVVTNDAAARAAAADLGAEVIGDVPDAGLNPALAYAATLVRPKGATATLPGVAALAADLPALRPAELTDALRAASSPTTDPAPSNSAVPMDTAPRSAAVPVDAAPRSAAVPVDAAPRSGSGPSVTARRYFVTDVTGTGSVLLAAAPGAGLEPCFGAGSASAHAASGAVELAGAWPSLRRDVDTADDLAEATRMGLGARTAAVIGAALVVPRAEPTVDAALAQPQGVPGAVGGG